MAGISLGPFLLGWGLGGSHGNSMVICSSLTVAPQAPHSNATQSSGRERYPSNSLIPLAKQFQSSDTLVSFFFPAKFAHPWPFTMRHTDSFMQICLCRFVWCPGHVLCLSSLNWDLIFQLVTFLLPFDIFAYGNPFCVFYQTLFLVSYLVTCLTFL